MSTTARRTVTVLAILIAAAGVVMLLVPKANAAPGGCVTRGEWSRVHDNMSRPAVQRILGSASEGSYQTYNSTFDGVEMWTWYRPCASFGNRHSLVVWYDDYSHNGPGFRVYDYYRSATV